MDLHAVRRRVRICLPVAVEAEPGQRQDPGARGPLIQGADHVPSRPAQQHPRLADVDRDDLKARHTVMLPAATRPLK